MGEGGGTQESKSYGYDFWDYQKDSSATAVYRDRGGPLGLCYLGLGLCGEAGEVAEKLKRVIRDHGGGVDDEQRDAISKELGDVLWYISEICTHLGIQMTDVAVGNVCKLRDRMERGVLGGNGDDR